MKGKLSAVLSTVCVAVVCVVTTVSVTLWAVNENKKDVGADGSITVNVPVDGGNISGTMSAGIQSNGQKKPVSGVVNGETVADMSAAQNIKNISSINVGDIELTMESNTDGYVNVWFEITNSSASALSVATILYGGTETSDMTLWEDTSNITAEVFFAPMTASKLLDKVNIAKDAEKATDIELGNADDDEIGEYDGTLTVEEYYVHFGIEKSRTAEIGKDKTAAVVVRYSVNSAEENIAKLLISISLTFSL
jgi:hypothetical protein